MKFADRNYIYKNKSIVLSAIASLIAVVHLVKSLNSFVLNLILIIISKQMNTENGSRAFLLQSSIKLKTLV